MTERSLRDIEEMQGAKYINPYTDFGFKKLFGTPLNKDLKILCDILRRPSHDLVTTVVLSCDDRRTILRRPSPFFIAFLLCFAVCAAPHTWPRQATAP